MLGIQVVAGYGIEVSDQLAHAGDQSHLLELAGGHQSLVEGADGVVVAGSGERGHVQSAPHFEAPADDTSPALACAGVVGVGGHADERADLAAIEPAELGQFRDQGGGSHPADTGHALQQPGHLGVVLFDVLSHVGLDVVKLAGDCFEQSLDAGAGDRARQAKPLALGELHAHQLAPARDQGGQVLLLGIGERADEALGIGPARQHPGELGQGGRVDAVGLGQPLHCASEVTRHARVDHGHAKTGCLQRTGKRRLIATGSLHQHQVRLQTRQALGQRAVAIGVVADLPQVCRQFGAKRRHIDVRTRNVDAYHHG